MVESSVTSGATGWTGSSCGRWPRRPLRRGRLGSVSRSSHGPESSLSYSLSGSGGGGDRTRCREARRPWKTGHPSSPPWKVKRVPRGAWVSTDPLRACLPSRHALLPSGEGPVAVVAQERLPPSWHKYHGPSSARNRNHSPYRRPEPRSPSQPGAVRRSTTKLTGSTARLSPTRSAASGSSEGSNPTPRPSPSPMAHAVTPDPPVTRCCWSDAATSSRI